MTPEQDGQNRGEKEDEKQREKEQEKKQEKGFDEKYKRNPLGVLSFGVLVVWLGVTLLLQSTDVIGNGDRGWAIFAWGGGVIIFVEAFLRLAVPAWRRPLIGSFVWGAVWAGVGFGLWYGNWEVIWPIVIIAVGVAILAGRLVPRR